MTSCSRPPGCRRYLVHPPITDPKTKKGTNAPPTCPIKLETKKIERDQNLALGPARGSKGIIKEEDKSNEIATSVQGQAHEKSGALSESRTWLADIAGTAKKRRSACLLRPRVPHPTTPDTIRAARRRKSWHMAYSQPPALPLHYSSRRWCCWEENAPGQSACLH
ncbi:hypothetical protein EJ06DRAFT_194674 [Trichodelitschia bisporula]|uniref:Uncharacterized protein n=1 Tax=Trichodelitschia bisporula TaxID=703511 RepID=A0A6G1I874_9PEZI|nr:hypothetical protein EJ06DRAFT_194674 [Trichodelitschia bisporula]